MAFQFATTPLWHGTSSVHLAALRQGIRSMMGENFKGDGQLGPGFYTTPDREAAEVFAVWAVHQRGGAPVIVRIVPPQRPLSGMIIPKALWWAVPGVLMETYDYLEAAIDSYEQHWSVKFNPRICADLVMQE